MGEPAAKLPDPEAWGDREIEHNTRLLEEYDSGRKQFTGDPAVLETVRMGLQWRADQQAGDADALELPFSTWRAANTPALPADAPLQPGEDPEDAPMAARPAPPPAAPQTPAQPPADSETSLWESFLGMGNSALRTADDAAGSFMRTDFTDKLGAAVADALPVPGINPEENTYAEGNSYQSMAQGLARDQREAEARSPWATATGDAAQTAAAAALYGPQNAAASLPARVGAGALEGATLGGTQRAGSAPADLPEEQLWSEYLEGAETGAMVGGGAPVVGAALGAGAQAVSSGRNALADSAQRAGWRNRAAATGVYGGELAKMVKQRGRDLPERIGETIERYGAHKRPPGGMLPEFVPQGPGVYADTTEAAMKQAGRQMGSAVDDATAAGATVDSQSLARGMRSLQADHLADGQPNNIGVADHIDTIVDDLTARRAGRGRDMTPREAWDYRHKMKPTAKLENDRNVMPSVGHQGQAYREGRDVIHDSVLESLGDAAPAYRSAEQDYGMLALANNASRQREAQELGNQLQAVNTPAAAAAGAVLGGAPGAAATIGMSETLKRVGRDATADVLGGASRALRVGDTAVATAPQRLTSAAESASLAGNANGIADDFLDASPAMAEPLPAPSTQREAGEHPSAARVRSALNQGDPSRYLGEYAGELEQALNEGPQKFGATLLRLQRDPKFMREVYPVIAAGEQGAGR